MLLVSQLGARGPKFTEKYDIVTATRAEELGELAEAVAQTSGTAIGV